MKTEVIVKKSGFSYLEVLFSLIIFFNLFVLFNQIFYNIKSNHEMMSQFKALDYEPILLKIDSDLKEATDYTIESNFISYHIHGVLYKYYEFNHHLTLQMDSIRRYLLNHINSISFQLDTYLLHITIIDDSNNIYQSTVILYDK